MCLYLTTTLHKYTQVTFTYSVNERVLLILRFALLSTLPEQNLVLNPVELSWPQTTQLRALLYTIGM